jgi:hypothetical protein
VARLVSDEVWRQLDPNAGRLSRTSVRRLWRAVGVALTAAALLALGWQSGVVVPRLEMPREAGLEYGGGPDQLYVVFTVKNIGSTRVTVTGAGRSGDGLELTDVVAQFPTTLDPGEQMTLRLVYRLTACVTGPGTAWRVPVRVEWWWAERTVDLEPPWPGNAWQRELADVVCDPPR